MIVYGRPGHQEEFGKAFIQGLARYNIKATYREGREPVECDPVVFWSHRKRNLIQHQRRRKRDYIVLERGYMGDRMDYTGIMLNGLNGTAHFPIAYLDRKRLERFDVKPLNFEGEYVLLIGQVNGDASLEGMDFNRWLDDAVREMKTDMPIVYRLHPLAKDGYIPKGVAVSDRTLEDDLHHAKAVVTYSSNVGVDALLAGKPVFAFGNCSMVKSLAKASFNVNSPYLYTDGERMRRLHEIANSQWTLDEIRRGIFMSQWNQYFLGKHGR